LKRHEPNYNESLEIVKKADIIVKIVEIDQPSRKMGINLIGTTSGRFSSKRPNLSNLPRTDDEP
jgi:DNA polymerase I-like protein with 3'-5' exonuclease and polymerase domains